MKTAKKEKWRNRKPTVYQDLVELERDGYAHDFINRYITANADSEIKKLIMSMSYLEIIHDQNKKYKHHQ